ncbi:hypothetical protein GALL_437720 [mine drainage metagenome]|uniref:Uncharacterized protein n=1 Tax=mine drainage metagenome TaxID=410659 RepID=A0A1J5Q3K8_9ZZZZ
MDSFTSFFAKQKRVSRYPIINWGRGRLLPYESLGSFAAKFCRLNGTTPREFRWFLDELVGVENWTFVGFDTPSVKKVARLLDEKESVVEKLDPDKLQLPGCYGAFNSLSSINQSLEQVTYCPECIKNGYHASFHEYPWLKMCPIHWTNLLKERVGSFGGGSKFDKYVSTLDHLFDHVSMTWLEIDTYSVVTAEIKTDAFRRFIRWIKAVQRIHGVMKARNLITLWGSNYSLDNIDVLLGRVAWATPFPKRFHELFHMKVKRLLPKITEYPIDVTNRLTSLITKIGYADLVWFYKKTVALADEQTKYRELVLKAVDDLKNQDMVHHSEWGWSKGMGWQHVDPDGWPYWGFMTPFHLAVIELKYEWTDFLRDDDQVWQRSSDWFIYCNLAQRLYESRVVSSADGGQWPFNPSFLTVPFFSPFIKLEIDHDLKSLIEDLLYEEASAHIDEIRSWLKAITKGAAPYETPTEKPSKGNLFNEPGRAYLMTWPVLTGTN